MNLRKSRCPACGRELKLYTQCPDCDIIIDYASPQQIEEMEATNKYS